MSRTPPRTVRTVLVSDPVWDTFSLMAAEMGADRDALVNQALFTFARLNGYLTPGQVLTPRQPDASSSAHHPFAAGALAGTKESVSLSGAPTPATGSRRLRRNPDFATFGDADPSIDQISSDNADDSSNHSFEDPRLDPTPSLDAEGDFDDGDDFRLNSALGDDRGFENDDGFADERGFADDPREAVGAKPGSPEFAGGDSVFGDSFSDDVATFDRSGSSDGPEPLESTGRVESPQHGLDEGLGDYEGGDWSSDARTHDSNPVADAPVFDGFENGVGEERDARERSDASPDASLPTLILSSDGNELGRVQAEHFLIGRGKHCDLIIHSGKVSREHAAIVFDDGAYHIEDLGSSNGTWFNRKRITRRRIEDGDEYFICSEKITCRYV